MWQCGNAKQGRVTDTHGPVHQIRKSVGSRYCRSAEPYNYSRRRTMTAGVLIKERQSHVVLVANMSNLELMLTCT